MEMSPAVLEQCCKEHKLYKTPYLNDKLYLNFKGFHTIENLEPYTAVRALFLEGNALDSLQGLPPLPELRCLFAQQNMIWEIDGLEGVEELDTLNLSNNNISCLQRLSHLTKLRTLLITNNRLASVEAIKHVAECQALAVLDLSNNRIDGTKEELMEVVQAMPNLTCLYLKGNPIVSSIRNYRKSIIAALPGLTYLDDRPVFELERKCAEGWVTGGLEGEREARRKHREAEEEADRRNHEFIMKVRAEGFRKRREALGLPPGDTDPAFDDMSDGEWEVPEEPEELVEARKKLAAYSARGGEEEPVELSKARQALAGEGVQIRESSASVPIEDLKTVQASLESELEAQLATEVELKAETLSYAAQSEGWGGHKIEVVVRDDYDEVEEEDGGANISVSLDELD